MNIKTLDPTSVQQWFQSRSQVKNPHLSAGSVRYEQLLSDKAALMIFLLKAQALAFQAEVYWRLASCGQGRNSNAITQNLPLALFYLLLPEFLEKKNSAFLIIFIYTSINIIPNLLAFDEFFFVIGPSSFFEVSVLLSTSLSQ